MNVLRTLLARSIDYAGLFPPARLSMSEAVSCYASYVKGPDNELLGRFVVAGQRLGEFARAAESQLPHGEQSTPWRVTALVGSDINSEREQILEFNAGHTAMSELGHVVCDSVEGRATTAAEIRSIRESFSDLSLMFVEIPAASAETLIPVIASEGAKAKIRTGGVAPDAFPQPREITTFIAACHRDEVAFKATAGLHHPLRAEYPLTYEPQSERAPMYGYLNLFLAAATILSGEEIEVAEEALMESDQRAIEASHSFLTWRGHRYDEPQIRRLRESLFLSFGSCSFVEPVTEIRALGLLP
jgi:hypothetical protein